MARTDAVQEMGWPDERRGPWFVRANWVKIGGRQECVGLTFWHGARGDRQSVVDYDPLPGGPTPISAMEFRSLPIGEIIATLREKAYKRDADRRVHSPGLTVFSDALGVMGLAQWAEPRRGRPPLYGPEHFVDVARVYTEAWEGSNAPTQAVADHFDVTRSAPPYRVASCPATCRTWCCST
jgi:hypothetical protein